MHIELSELKETTVPLKNVQPYPVHKPMGFYDTNGQFMLVVTHRGDLMKKRIPHKYTQVEKAS